MPAAALHFLLGAHVSVLLLYTLDFMLPVHFILSISLMIVIHILHTFFVKVWMCSILLYPH